MRLVLLLGILLVSSAACSDEKWSDEKWPNEHGENKVLSLSSDIDISYTHYPSKSKKLLVWIPSEYGNSAEFRESAQSIAASGINLWVLNLHESYMEPPGRQSMKAFSADDITELMQQAKQQGYQQIILAAVNRGAVLALHAGRNWQLKYKDDKSFSGFVFLHPHLIQGRVGMGDDAQYLPISRAVNKPVFILQPEYAVKYLHTHQVIEQFAKGGAETKVKKLKGISAGFHVRPEDELSEKDLQVRGKMGNYMTEAIAFLQQAKQPSEAVSLEKNNQPVKQAKRRLPTLYPFKGNPQPAPLRLKAMDGKSYSIDELKGKVVLINFWASWCGPCVKEIPSLNRLVEKMQGKEFQLLTVDIKEPPSKIKAFFKELGIQAKFPVLMDTDGKVSQAWKVYAYPSNYLLDKTGKIRYGYTGALEWDSPKVIEIIDSLLL